MGLGVSQEELCEHQRVVPWKLRECTSMGKGWAKERRGIRQRRSLGSRETLIVEKSTRR